MPTYTMREMMTVAAAREIRDGDIVFCGTGISMLAAMAAKRISAPDCVIFFETGAIDSRLEEVPLSVGDPRIMFSTTVNAGLTEAFATMQNPFTGPRIVAILGAAQIDRYGNLNSTVIGDYTKPSVRFSGSGGAPDAASLVGRTLIFVQHERRKFVPKLDYFSTPGWIDGPGGRRRIGLGDNGPSAVITNLAVMRFDLATREMYLWGHYRGVSPQDVIEHTGFPVDTSRALEVPPPSEVELRILREEVDPQGLMLG